VRSEFAGYREEMNNHFKHLSQEDQNQLIEDERRVLASLSSIVTDQQLKLVAQKQDGK
jgi:hypothetical protein